MTEREISIKPGDWVRITPLWPGIWNVYRVLAGFKEDEWSIDEPLKPSKRILVFCHRLVNDSWKRSFAHQSCEVSLVRPADNAEKKRLNALLSSDRKLRKAFEQYQTKQNRIDLVANIGFGGLTKKETANFAKLCDEIFGDRIDAGFTIPQVLGLLREHGLEKNRHELPQQVTLQLTCINHELRSDEFVHKEYRVLPF
jgi:hypothetical protein